MHTPFLSLTRLGVAIFPDNSRECNETSAAVDSVADFAPTRFFWAACKASCANLSTSVELMIMLVVVTHEILSYKSCIYSVCRATSHAIWPGFDLWQQKERESKEKCTRTHRFVLTATTEQQQRAVVLRCAADSFAPSKQQLALYYPTTSYISETFYSRTGRDQRTNTTFY